jgi:hypothetical protein
MTAEERKIDRELLKIITNIRRNVEEKKWICLYPDCNENAINSHLLQKNGILNYLVEDGHLIEIKGNEFVKIEKEGALISKRVGINKAISQPLFCNKHDTNIFKGIETHPIDFSNSKVQMLFSYRSLCSELRKKQKAIENFTRQEKSHIIQANANPASINYGKKALEGFKIGASDLMKFKIDFEKEILDDSPSYYVFKTFTYDLIKVCVSAMFSPIQPDSDALIKAWKQEQPLSSIFINVIPQANALIIIIGYHKNFIDDWIANYIKSWTDLDIHSLQLKLTDLISTRVETWSIAPSLFNKIPKATKNKFVKYWNANSMNLDTTQNANFNLFG